MLGETQLEKTGVRWKNKETAKNEWRFQVTGLCCKSICTKARGWKRAVSDGRLYKSNKYTVNTRIHYKNLHFSKFGYIGSSENRIYSSFRLSSFLQ